MDNTDLFEERRIQAIVILLIDILYLFDLIFSVPGRQSGHLPAMCVGCVITHG